MAELHEVSDAIGIGDRARRQEHVLGAHVQPDVLSRRQTAQQIRRIQTQSENKTIKKTFAARVARFVLFADALLTDLSPLSRRPLARSAGLFVTTQCAQ